MRVVLLAVTVEAKDEYVTDPGADTWGPGAEPEPAEVAAALGDVLADRTKHDVTLGWRVLNVSAGP